MLGINILRFGYFVFVETQSPVVQLHYLALDLKPQVKNLQKGGDDYMDKECDVCKAKFTQGLNIGVCLFLASEAGGGTLS